MTQASNAAAKLAVGGITDGATNVAGGLANQLPVQTAPNTTGFIPAPSTASTFLQYTGSGFAWAAAGGGSGYAKSISSVSVSTTLAAVASTDYYVFAGIPAVISTAVSGSGTAVTYTYSSTSQLLAVGQQVVVSGSVPAGYNGTFTVTAIATVSAGSSYSFTVANTTSAAATTLPTIQPVITMTLPTAVGNTDTYVIKNTNSGIVTLATTSSQTIEGSSSQVSITQYQSLALLSDGSNWRII